MNRKKYITSLILAFLCYTATFAQSYTIRQIHAAADSTIRAAIGDSIPVEYRMWTYMLDYQYTKGKSKKIKTGHWRTNDINDKTKGDFHGAEIKYHIYFRDKHNVGWKSYGLPVDFVRIDAAFNLTTPVKFAGIPQYILDDDTTKFITYEQAIQIIKDQFPVDRKTKEIQEHYQSLYLVPYMRIYPEPEIRYKTDLLFEKSTLRRHHWRVVQIVCCASIEMENIDKELMKEYGHVYNYKDLCRKFYIDAMTGEIIQEESFTRYETSW